MVDAPARADVDPAVENIELPAGSAAASPDPAEVARARDARRAELVEAALDGRLRGLIEPVDWFSFSAFHLFERCPLAYALKYVCGLEPPEPIPAFVFGSAAHRAFELFTRARRTAAEADEPAPGRDALDRCFAEAWGPAAFPDEATKAWWFGRAAPMLDRFWATEQARPATTVGEELRFRLPIEAPDGAQIILSGIIDRIDRRPDGSLELLDYKTGSAWSPLAGAYGLQLAIYALGCRDALGFEAPVRGLLYFVEHGLFAVKRISAGGLDATRAEAGERAAAIRASEFAPTPSPSACRFCDFRELCPAWSAAARAAS